MVSVLTTKKKKNVGEVMDMLINLIIVIFRNVYIC